MNRPVHSAVRCHKCDNCFVHNRAICRVADEEALAEFNRISHYRSFERGQTIIAQNEPATIVGNVVAGTVKLCRLTEEGDQQVLGLMFPSDFFGRVYKEKSRFSFEAASDVILCCIDRAEFERLIARFPAVEEALLKYALDDLDAQREWTNLVSRRTTLQRVSFFLFVLSRRLGNQTCAGSGGQPSRNVILPIGRQDIADFLGTTPETLSRNFHQLQKERVIRIIDPARFEILDDGRLIAHCGETREDLLESSILPHD